MFLYFVLVAYLYYLGQYEYLHLVAHSIVYTLKKFIRKLTVTLKTFLELFSC